VGKTTSAAARAVAESSRGARVLAVSTDPAHSLGDALDVRLSARPARVRVPRASFQAVELDASRAFRRWLTEHYDALGDVLSHGTWLDRTDIDALLRLPLPGIDELVGMLEIVALARRAPHDLIVVDTAPTGHTLRLLAAPDAVAAIATVLDALQEEHRIIRDEFGRGGHPEAADRLIETLAREATDTRTLLRDVARTSFVWVMLPEELSLAESKDGVAALRRAGIRIAEVIVNRVLAEGPPCALCDPRRVEEHRVVRKIRRAFGTIPVRLVLDQVLEPRGAKALAVIASTQKQPPKLPRASREHEADIHRARPAAPETIDALRGARLLLIGGKGGVGKTTVAAAVALRLAAASARRVLLLSTDPAHSLGDVFGQRIGDRATIVRGGPKNLAARELDAAAVLEARRAGLESALSEVQETVGARAPVASHLMDLAPPGIDELFALLTVTELTGLGVDSKAAADRPPYDVIVVDTAPTGHALRLLEMPGVAREWVQVIMRVLLKYRSVVRPGQLAQEVVELSQSIRRLQSLLQDPARARFVVVTRAAVVPALETNRLLERLRRMKLAVPAVIVNARTLAPSCPRCRAVASAERRAVSALVRHCRRRQCAIIQTPLVAPPPRGSRMLSRWAGRWTA
jgi:arsenite/tail-anchored protein-transporting ATPase